MRESRSIANTYDIQLMMTTVHHWLNYMHKVSRIDMLAESSIIYPTMEYIERSTNAEKCYMERAYDEFTTTIFKNKKYVDLMWEGESDIFLMEFKYVGTSTSAVEERQRYFNDITRLSLALKYKKNENKNIRCFFVVCGKEDLYEDQVLGRRKHNAVTGVSLTKKKGRKPKIKSEFNNWIALDNTQKDIFRSIEYKNTELRRRFLYFIAEYYLGNKDKTFTDEEGEELLKKYENTFVPKFFTQRISIMNEGNMGGQVLGIWEVLLKKE